MRTYRRKEAVRYVEIAEQSIDKKEAERCYKQALSLFPDGEVIYQSIINYFISPNDFQTEDATLLTSLILTFYKEKTVLDIFRENRPKEYLEFCYALGIGYFYDKGGAGKQWIKNLQ